MGLSFLAQLSFRDGDGDIDAVISNAISFTQGTIDSRIETFYNDGTGVFTADTNPVANNTKEIQE